MTNVEKSTGKPPQWRNRWPLTEWAPIFVTEEVRRYNHCWQSDHHKENSNRTTKLISMSAFRCARLDLCCQKCLLFFWNQLLRDGTSHTHCSYRRTVFGGSCGCSRRLFDRLFGHSASSRRTPSRSNWGLFCLLCDKTFFRRLLGWRASYTTSSRRSRSRTSSSAWWARPSSWWRSSWRCWTGTKWKLLLQEWTRKLLVRSLDQTYKLKFYLVVKFKS